MIWYYDWEGCHKQVCIGGKTYLCDASCVMEDLADKFLAQYGGRPSITSIIPVSEDFYNQHKHRYEEVGLLCEGNGDNAAGGIL